MVTHFFMEGNTIGCDFSGVVEEAGESSMIPVGTRVCGADFPYRPNNPSNGAFSRWVLADSRQMLKLPDGWSDAQGAALGAIGWGTVSMAMSDPQALNLEGLPSKPSSTNSLVLVYGGATATGLLAIQMLSTSGYKPIAVCSAASAPLCRKFGAVGTADYMATDCLQNIKNIAAGAQIKHALDCITDADSTATCFSALSRAGGRYACLEACPAPWRTRRAVKVKVVMGFEMQGHDVDLGDDEYRRMANAELFDTGCIWAKEMQTLLNAGRIATQPFDERRGGFEAVIQAVEALRNGEAKGKKLVVRVDS
ncbi:hypothetical protein KCU89_g712, partial [Aureobasidium melanogenum]